MNIIWRAMLWSNLYVVVTLIFDNMKELIGVLFTAEMEEKFSPMLSEDFLIGMLYYLLVTDFLE